MKITGRIFKKIAFTALLLLILCSAAFAAETFRAAMPSPFTNESPERFFEARGCTVRTFLNPVTFSCGVHVIKSEAGNILVDPGYYDGDLKDYVKSIGSVDAVLISHCHVDHIIGLNALKKDYPDAKVYIYAPDLDGLYDIYTNYSYERIISEPFIIDFDVLPLDGGTHRLAGHNVKVIPSPGHSIGSALYSFPDEGLLFVGDTVAFGGIPRLDLPNSNIPELFETLTRVKALDVPAETEVFFGHGEHIAYGRMLETYTCFARALMLGVKTGDGGSVEIKDFYFDGETLMMSLEEMVKIAGTGYFQDGDSVTAHLPQMGRLTVRAGGAEAELDGFPINMKGPAALRDGKIYLPGKFIGEIFKGHVTWGLAAK